MLKNVTLTVEEEALRWARRQAAEKNTSVSKLLGRMIEDEMRRTDEYWKAYERLKKIKPIPGVDASRRAMRDETSMTGDKPFFLDTMLCCIGSTPPTPKAARRQALGRRIVGERSGPNELAGFERVLLERHP